MQFKDKVILVTGASRGIGKAIALRLGSEGARIAICAKTEEPHPQLDGTIYSAAKEIESKGGQALPLKMDIRFEDEVIYGIKAVVKEFGGIDILVNNSSAISLTDTISTPMKKFDLMHQVNVRGTFMVSKYCLPYLIESQNPHILNLAPPMSIDSNWFSSHLAYTIAKYGMSLCVFGMSEEFAKWKIGVNAVWPETLIATDAVKNLLGGKEAIRGSRKPEIVADAAYFILKRKSATCSGNFFIDSQVLKEEGIEDLSHYAVDKSSDLNKDLFL